MYDNERLNFDMFIIERIDGDYDLSELKNKEQYYIDYYDTIENGLNKYRSGNCADRKEYMREYDKSEKRKEYKREYMREYEKSEKRKEYEKSEKRKEYQKTWEEEHKEYRKQYYRDLYQKKKLEKQR